MPIRVTGVLALDGRAWEAGIRKAETEAGRFANKLGGELKSKFAAAFSVTAVVAYTKGLIELGGQIQDTATRLSISTDAAQEFKFAAEQSGGSIESVQKGLEQLGKSLDEARAGAEKYIAAFKRLGITNEDIRSKNPEAIFKQIGDGMAGMLPNAERSTSVLEVFGKAGGELIPILKELRDKSKEIRDAGGILTPQEIKNLDDAGDKLNKLNTVSKAGGAGLSIVGSNLATSLGRMFVDPLDMLAESFGRDMGRGPATAGLFERFFSNQIDGTATLTAMTEKLKKLEEEKARVAKAAADAATEAAKEREKELKRIATLNEQTAAIEEKAALKPLSKNEQLNKLLEKRAKILATIAALSTIEFITGMPSEETAKLRKQSAETSVDIATLQADKGSKFKTPSDALVRVGNFLGATGQSNITQIQQQQLGEIKGLRRDLRSYFGSGIQTGFRGDINESDLSRSVA